MANESKAGKVTAADGHVYHKSATANASEAPTNEYTKQNIIKDVHLGSDALEFITLVHYEYGLTGKVDFDYLSVEYGWEKNVIDAWLDRDLVVKALEERGVPIKRALMQDETLIKRNKLNPLQLIVANTYLDLTDTRSVKKKLQDLNVTTATWQMWLRDEHFNQYLKARAENLIGDYQHEALLALADKVASGDLKAIQYYHEFTGRFIPQRGSDQGSSANVNFQQMVIQIVEIIVDEVDDVAIAGRIVDRLKGLVAGNVVAGVIEQPPVGEPEIAKPREITPTVQEMMQRGLGYDS